MVFIVISILWILFYGGTAIYYFIKEGPSKLLFFFLGISLVGILFLILSISEYKYGPYKELVKEYGMKYSDKLKEYSKNGLSYTISKNEYRNYHYITDKKQNVELQFVIVKRFYDIDKRTISVINEYLNDYSTADELPITINIQGNHVNIDIVYNYDDNIIRYKIIKEDASYTEGSGENKKTIKNIYYDRNYVDKKIEFKYYKEEYMHYYEDIAKSLFGDYEKLFLYDSIVFRKK